MNRWCWRDFAIATGVALVMTLSAGSAWGSGLKVHATRIAGVARPISSEASVFGGNRTASQLFGGGGAQLGDSSPSGGSPPVLYGGGPVMHAVTTHLIAWAPSGFSFPSGYVSGYAQYLSDLSQALGQSSNVSSVLAQYVDASGSALSSLTNDALISDTDSYPPPTSTSACHVSGASVCLTQVQLLKEVTNEIANNALNSDLNQSYILLLPPGVDSCYDNSSPPECEGQAFCGYHAAFPVGSHTATFTLVPYTGSSFTNTGGHCELPTGPGQGPGPAGLSPELIALESIGTHELFESATDPVIGLGYVDSAGYEIADECEFTFGPESAATGSGFYNQLIDGSQYLVQEMWSDQDNDCARGEATTATAAITAPPIVRTGSTVRLSATLANDSASAGSYHWSYTDPLGENRLNVASGRSPQIRLPIAGTYNVWVTITDAAGGTVTGVRHVAVRVSHRPRPWFTWSPAHPTAGMTVRFSPRGVASAESITRYSWRFGHGRTSSWAIPSHVYGTVGHHTVTLTVRQDGRTGRVRRSIVVAARRPSSTWLGKAIALTGERLDIASLLSNNGTRSTVSYGGTTGRIVITWNGTVKHRNIVVARGAQTVRSGGTARVTIKLTAAGRALLAKSKDDQDHGGGQVQMGELEPDLQQDADDQALGGQGLVELVGARAGEVGDNARGRARLRARLDQLAHRRERRAQILVAARRRRPDHEHNLAPGWRLRVARRQVGGGAAHDLLVKLRQLATNRHRPLRVEFGEHCQRGGHPARGLECHQRLLVGEGRLELGAFARQEAGEAPVVGRQRACDERRERRRRPRQHLDREPGRDAGADQHEAGVRHQRHARVGDERDDVTVVHTLDELGRARLLVLLVVADEFPGDAVVLEQRAGPARVLAGDQVGRAQCGQDAQRDVLEVADRGRADDQLSAHRRTCLAAHRRASLAAHRCTSLAASPSSASAAAPTRPAS